MKKIFVVLVLVFVLACSENMKDLKPVTINLKWLHQAQFAGIYTAKELGYYKQTGLEVYIKRGGVDAPAIPAVLSGKADYGIASADDIIVARSEDKPVKAIAVIYKISPVVYFSLKDKEIESPYDFPERVVGIKHGTGTDYPYITMINKLGINRSRIKEKDVGFDMERLYSGEIDVWPGFRINEPQTAREDGYEVNEIYPEEYGVIMYADVLFTTEDRIEENPEEVNAFVTSTLKGWQYVVENEEESLEFVLNYAKDADREHQRYMLAKSIPLIHTGDSQLGYMDQEVWKNMIDILNSNKVINVSVNPEEVYTNNFI